MNLVTYLSKSRGVGNSARRLGVSPQQYRASFGIVDATRPGIGF